MCSTDFTENTQRVIMRLSYSPGQNCWGTSSLNRNRTGLLFTSLGLGDAPPPRIFVVKEPIKMKFYTRIYHESLGSNMKKICIN